VSEHSIQINAVDPVEVLGANDQNLRIIRNHFPKLNLIARGDVLKVIGADEDIAPFLERWDQLVQHVVHYNELPRKVLDDIMGVGLPNEAAPEEADVLVHGNAGLRVKARTRNQQARMARTSRSSLGASMATRSPGPTPRAASAQAWRATASSRSRKVWCRTALRPSTSPTWTSAVLSGCRCSARCKP